MRVLIIIALSLYFVKGQQPVASRDFERHPIRFCPGNQQWFQCGPPCGDRRCPRPINYLAVANRCDSRRCGDPGCYCKSDYVRDENGRCIPESDCQPRCNENESVDRCGNECDRQCPSTSADVGRQQPCQQRFCTGPACVCNQGYYRSPRGYCVKLEDCPDICNSNEYYNPCGNACEKSCNDFHSGGPKMCTEVCRQRGACQCKDGFYRNFQGRCVPPSICRNPNTFCRGFNEIFDDCAPPLVCQEKCGRANFHRSCFPKSSCRPGCICKDGYVRNNDDECILRDRCNGRRGDHK